MTEQVIEWIKAEKLIAQGDCVIAGVSGGADSVCLLRLLLEIQKKMDFTLEAVHVEHGIRGEESRGDAAFVRTLCDSFHVPCHIYAVDVPSYAKEKGLGLEEAARIKRYECYRKEIEKRKEEKRTVRVALAHHADDNAETLLFQMIRGSGIVGLAGMRAKRPLMEGAELIRPLLNVQRREIESYLNGIGQEYREDSTNADTDYSRNRIRHNILPELSEINERAVSHMNRSAGMLRQAADYLARQAIKRSPAERSSLLQKNLRRIRNFYKMKCSTVSLQRFPTAAGTSDLCMWRRCGFYFKSRWGGAWICLTV